MTISKDAERPVQALAFLHLYNEALFIMELASFSCGKGLRMKFYDCRPSSRPGLVLPGPLPPGLAIESRISVSACTLRIL